MKQNKADLSANWRMIKQFARYELITFTQHAVQTMEERNISKNDIYQVLKSANSTIVQHHEAGTYNNNQSPVDVVFGQVKNNKKKFFLHVVVAIEKECDSGVTIKVITTYIPSNEFFYASGRIVKRRAR